MRRDDVVAVSALTGESVEPLLAAASEAQGCKRGAKGHCRGHERSALAWLHAHGEILDQHTEELETRSKVRLSDADWARFLTHQT
jgi:GTP-binding protein HflX